ncbi:unnamed protein product [Owenia fusiformis]|uniref:Aminopeptidase n=1 Tax=Owenia fusiformis TaxID=6347 RepID=A0A8J1XX29_OWEFU|nr:unnamed protein product [Owenia fusiformis]
MTLESKPGFYVTKRNAVIIIVLFALIITGVGLLAGLTRAPCPKIVQVTPAPGGGGIQSTTTAPSSTTITISQTTIGPEPWYQFRLPKNIIPLHYNLLVRPDFEASEAWFWGNVSIQATVTLETKYIIMHCKELNITSARVTNNANTDDIPISKRFEHKPMEFCVIETTTLIPGDTNITVDVEFNGSLDKGNSGIYKSEYFNTDLNSTRSLAMTQFASTDARKGFPCFDEPQLKATFTVSLQYPTGYVALGNMPNKTSRILADNMMETTFERTPSMSTYLVCFVISDFHYKEATLKSGKPIRVWAPSDRIREVDLSLETGKNITDWYESYFNMSYHLPKIDMIGIPDLPFGAMENWGLITYRVTRLLYNEEQNTARDKQSTLAVVAHELAHNYVGNVVTAAWWEDIWLNEGFATFFENKGVLSVFPEWEMLEQFVPRSLHTIMESDSFDGVRMIAKPVTDPAGLRDVYSGIVYRKGGSMMRLLEQLMGETDFIRGMQNYLKKFEYGNPTTDQFISEMQQVYNGNIEIKTMLDTWLRQSGHPLVTITTKDNMISASQRRFVKNSNDTFSEKWYVPLSYTYVGGSTTHTVWMNITDVSFPSPVTDQAIKFNSQNLGFYRVDYTSLWQRLATTLQNNINFVPATDRSNLLDDVFVLALDNRLSYNVALEMTKFLRNEVHYVPWLSAIKGLNQVESKLWNRKSYGNWRTHLRGLSREAMTPLQVTDTGSHLNRLLRPLVIQQSCWVGDPDCLTNSTRLFLDFINQNISIPANVRAEVLKFGMQQVGGEKEWDQVFHLYKTTSSFLNDKLRYLESLAYVRERWLKSRFLDYTLDDSKLPIGEFTRVVRYVSATHAGRRMAWDWVRQNWDALIDRFSSSTLLTAVSYISATYNNQLIHDEVVSFLQDKFNDVDMSSRIQSISNTIQSNIQWLERHENTVQNWLENN